ncbi:MAG: hypothetical protein EZS28_013302 [Streblomastix strix]|uniref:Uncharacterized protein n=1 Tax=Streblomastix strix TaxID=222440 RepID=A0A5J4W8I7_9EUKA|nr:MAG: hypothetical protein EZS28_013302 [Streblomastix strix]
MISAIRIKDICEFYSIKGRIYVASPRSYGAPGAFIQQTMFPDSRNARSHLYSVLRSGHIPPYGPKSNPVDSFQTYLFLHQWPTATVFKTLFY